jgi:hypothetical protein
MGSVLQRLSGRVGIVYITLPQAIWKYLTGDVFSDLIDLTL